MYLYKTNAFSTLSMRAEETCLFHFIVISRRIKQSTGGGIVGTHHKLTFFCLPKDEDLCYKEYYFLCSFIDAFVLDNCWMEFSGFGVNVLGVRVSLGADTSY